MSAMRRRLLTIGLMVGVICALAFYVELYLYSPSRDMDLKVFTAAATALEQHANPYDERVLLPIQEAQAHRFGAGARAYFRLNPYLSPPLMAAFLRGIGKDARLWTSLQILAVLLGTALCVWWAGGTRRPLWLLVLPFGPACYLAVFYGQISPFMLVSVAGSFLLARRQPGLAAAVLVLGMFKPPIMAGPLLLLGIRAWKTHMVRPFFLGIVAAAAAVLLGTSALLGPDLMLAWLRTLLDLAGTNLSREVFDPASLSFILYALVSARVAALATLVLLVGWGVLAIRACPGADAPTEEWRVWLAVMLAAWLLVGPDVHPHDDVLLIPALCLLLRDRVAGLTYAAVACWIALPLLWLLGVRVPLIEGLGALVPAAVVVALAAPNWRTTDVRRGDPAPIIGG